MTVIFVKASDDMRDECLSAAANWINEPNQHMFTSTRNAAVSAVAEYLANQKGFTLYNCNATYPKGEK